MLARATIQEDKKKLGTHNRPKFYRCLLGAACAAELSVLLATGTVSYAAAADGSPVTGGTVVAGIDPGQLSTFNTQLTSVTSSLVVADVWADGLMTYDRNGYRFPRLAESWEVSSNGLTY